MNPVKDDFRCIAVDMGAGSIRVMLGFIGHDGLGYKEIHRVTNDIVKIDGHDRWDMERIVGEIKVGIVKAIEASGIPPLSIGVDSWGVDFVMLDDSGEMVETPVAYRDNRTEGMQELWKQMQPEMETFKRTGINFYIFNTLFQLLSMKDSGELNRACRILFFPCYINYLLSGNAHNELTISSTSQVLSVQGDQWDPEILGILNLDRQLLGDVIPAGTRLGTLSHGRFGAGQAELRSPGIAGDGAAHQPRGAANRRQER